MRTARRKTNMTVVSSFNILFELNAHKRIKIMEYICAANILVPVQVYLPARKQSECK